MIHARVRPSVLLSALLSVMLSVLLAGCGAGTASTHAPSATATATASPAPVLLIKVKTITLARKRMQVLGDLNGKTLYYFKPDTSTTVTCTASCAQLWPPLLVSQGAPTAATTLSGQLSVVVGADGRQVTYNGHPLYTYSKDGDASDAYGQGIGGQWYVATPGLAGAS